MRVSQAILEQALNAARAMRESGDDPEHLAKALLSEHERLQEWQKVIAATKLFLRSGMATTEHARLVKTLHEVEASEERLDKQAHFGLE